MGNPGQDERDSGMMPNGIPGWSRTGFRDEGEHRFRDEDGYSALYTRAQSLFRDLAMARADGSLRTLLARVSRIDVLVVDDWAMAPLSEPERRDFWEICEDRYQVRSTILTSQLPVARWHEQIGDPTLAEASSTAFFTMLIGSR